MNAPRNLIPAMLIVIVLCLSCACQKSEQARHLLKSAPGDALRADGPSSYCIHEVVALRPFKGDCKGFEKGDRICLRCEGGKCLDGGRFIADDGFILSACYVDTQVVDSSCKQELPSGSCKEYRSVVKD